MSAAAAAPAAGAAGRRHPSASSPSATASSSPSTPSRSRCGAARSSASSARTAPARPPPSRWSRACAHPDGGSVVVDGLPVWPDPTPVKARIGVQLQATALFDYLRLHEIIYLFGSCYGMRRTPAEIDALLDAGRPAREARQLRRPALRRPGAAPLHRPGAGQRPGGHLSRRAHHRPRPARPARPVGRHPRDQRGRHHRRAHDALHGRGRAPLRPRRRHGPRPHRGARHAAGAGQQPRRRGARHLHRSASRCRSTTLCALRRRVELLGATRPGLRAGRRRRAARRGLAARPGRGARPDASRTSTSRAPTSRTSSCSMTGRKLADEEEEDERGGETPKKPRRRGFFFGERRPMSSLPRLPQGRHADVPAQPSGAVLDVLLPGAAHGAAGHRLRARLRRRRQPRASSSSTTAWSANVMVQAFKNVDGVSVSLSGHRGRGAWQQLEDGDVQGVLVLPPGLQQRLRRGRGPPRGCPSSTTTPTLATAGQVIGVTSRSWSRSATASPRYAAEARHRAARREVAGLRLPRLPGARHRRPVDHADGIFGIAGTLVTYKEKGVLRRLQATPMPLSSFIGSNVAHARRHAPSSRRPSSSPSACSLFHVSVNGSLVHRRACWRSSARGCFVSLGLRVAAVSKNIEVAQALMQRRADADDVPLRHLLSRWTTRRRGSSRWSSHAAHVPRQRHARRDHRRRTACGRYAGTS